MEEPHLAGWFYRLTPNLVLRTGGPSPAPELGERVLWLKSGAAFPPGHPTTRLCLDLLREALAAGLVTSLLDVGCGAGVLGLAAAALGVPRVVAVDISRGAAQVTWENARENALADALKVVQGSTQCLQGLFDLVMANLPVEVQGEKVLELDRLAAPQGRLILSGFRDNQEGLFMEDYLQLGWTLGRRAILDFWHPELPPDLSFNWVAWLLEKADEDEAFGELIMPLTQQKLWSKCRHTRLRGG